MPAKKMRVEVYDESGNRYTISFEGRVTRKNALRILDIVELLGGMPGTNPEIVTPQNRSKFDKIRMIIEKNLPIIWFSAKQVKTLYETKIDESINLTTVSTYLARLSERGFLVKKKHSNRVFYKLVSNEIEELLNKY